jgi:hypothetical protein
MSIENNGNLQQLVFRQLLFLDMMEGLALGT